jgi:hypothetical protein
VFLRCSALPSPEEPREKQESPEAGVVLGATFKMLGDETFDDLVFE